MSTFTLTARVVVHKDDARKQPHPTDAKEYDTLHAEMHARGYCRFYANSSDEKRKLPPGEYTIEVDADDGAAARMVATETPSRPATTLISTCAESGISSKCLSAGSIPASEIAVVIEASRNSRARAE